MLALILVTMMVLATPAALTEKSLRDMIGDDVVDMLSPEERCWQPICERQIKDGAGGVRDNPR